MRQDARVWQAVVLGGILLLGIFSLDFPLPPAIIAATLVSGTLGEYLLGILPRAGREPRPLSALISGLSVLLLFRSSVWWTYPLVILFAVASKYLIQFQGRHWLNPTNFAVLIGCTFLPGWISSGQWGHVALLPLALGGLGILVLLRAGRLDSALTFLATSAALEYARLLYYGYPHPFDIFVHRLNNGALWLFTFYMLTDPKTTPQQRWGRIVHASLVALLTFFLAEWWYWKDTFLWALLFAAPLVPTLDWLQDSIVNRTSTVPFTVRADPVEARTAA
jgi:Na+-translocating ferredoxin:NAD+ oxidoreductase RnfD subunit